MNNDYPYDSAPRPEETQPRTAQQTIKRAYEEQTQRAPASAPVRRRRSGRDAQPRAEEAPEWVRREPPAAPDEDGSAYTRRRPALEDDEYDKAYARRGAMTQDDEDEQEPRGKLWIRALAVMLVIVAGLCAALYFLPDLGPLKGAQQSLRGAVQSVRDTISPVEPEISALQIVTNSGVTGERIYLQATASRSVKGVRLEDIAGNEVPCTVSRVNSQDDDTQVYGITLTFSEPFEGEVFAAYTDGKTWQQAEQWVMLSVAEPTPVPTPIPVETPAPVQTPVPEVPTLAPAVQPQVTQLPENQ